ncbi:hypothetical protein GCM10012289_22480 [Nonomuraea cavernae]|uniref:Uncharacterized protein n=1 Tax=Nonomuraea cavernae TaxID=2045107 RepID=A0A917YUF1_9ACTN|nr:hypothetical protein GCM10012289_22480 [Nonomuraea cavernae]
MITDRDLYPTFSNASQLHYNRPQRTFGHCPISSDTDTGNINTGQPRLDRAGADRVTTQSGWLSGRYDRLLAGSSQDLWRASRREEREDGSGD